VQAKHRGHTISLARWIVDPPPGSFIDYAGDALDCRRSRLFVRRKRAAYHKRIEGISSETEREAYVNQLARLLAERIAIPQPEIAWRLRRGQDLPPEAEEAATSLPRIRRQAITALRIRSSGWQHRIPDLVAELRDLSQEFLGRADIERLFDVSRMSAVRILDRFGPEMVSGRLQIPRLRLIERLETFWRDPHLEHRRNRHQEIVAAAGQARHVVQSVIERSLAEIATHLQQEQKQTIVAESSEANRYLATRFGKLPAGVNLELRRLTIDFEGFHDLLFKFGAFLYAMQNSTDEIAQFVESSRTIP